MLTLISNRHLKSKVFEYKGKLSYNDFFNPNICHICKRRSTGYFIPCKLCELVYYCDCNLANLHCNEHNQICQLIYKHLSDRLPDVKNKFKYWREWMESRKELLQIVQKDLDREMKEFEKQIILFSKHCIKCHKQVELQTCERCLSVNYCMKHAEYFRMEHTEDDCDKLAILLNVKIARSSSGMANVLNKKYERFFSSSYLSKENNIENMHTLFRECGQFSASLPLWTSSNYVMTDYISEPLTVYHVLQKLKFSDSKCTVHIIDANSVNNLGMQAWEILFHLLPELRLLVIVLIGPNLKNYDVHDIKCCGKCQNKNFYTFVESKSYYDFLRIIDKNNNKKPNIIVGFHAELYEGWEKCIEAMSTQECPLVLTALSKQQANKNKQMIEKVTSKYNNKSFITLNNFHSYVPQIEIETGEIYLRHEMLTIYHV